MQVTIDRGRTELILNFQAKTSGRRRRFEDMEQPGAFFPVTSEHGIRHQRERDRFYLVSTFDLVSLIGEISIRRNIMHHWFVFVSLNQVRGCLDELGQYCLDQQGCEGRRTHPRETNLHCLVPSLSCTVFRSCRYQSIVSDYQGEGWRRRWKYAMKFRLFWLSPTWNRFSKWLLLPKQLSEAYLHLSASGRAEDMKENPSNECLHGEQWTSLTSIPVCLAPSCLCCSMVSYTQNRDHEK